MVSIDRVGPDGWQRVRAVRLRALRDSPDAFWRIAEEEEARTPEEWRAQLERPDTVTVIAVDDGADVGMAAGATHHEHHGDAGLYAMWVAPEARGSGAAVALVAAVVDWARAAGYRQLRLEVVDSNERAVRFYARLGFAPTGMTARFPPPREHITEHERALHLRPR